MERGRSLARSASPETEAPIKSRGHNTITRCDRGPVALRRGAAPPDALSSRPQVFVAWYSRHPSCLTPHR